MKYKNQTKAILIELLENKDKQIDKKNKLKKDGHDLK